MTQPTPIDCSIVIVSWNVRDLLRANLARLFSLPTNLRLEVFVVDNGSHDGTAAVVRTEFPNARLITNDWDAGFAGPNNQALRLARGTVCLLLNPDMLVEPGALEATHAALTGDRTIGVLGGRLLDVRGTPIIGSVRRFPDVWSQLAIVCKAGKLFPPLLDRYLWRDFDFSSAQDVDQVRGSFFAFRRELLDTVGYLDPEYHIWFEEVDYCRRVRAAGLRVRYIPDAIARDYVGRGVAQMGHLEKQRIFTASMCRYFRKWHPTWQWVLVALARPIGLLAAASADGWIRLRSLHTPPSERVARIGPMAIGPSRALRWPSEEHDGGPQRQDPRATPHRSSIAAGLAALALFQFHPFYVPTVAVLLVAWTFVESIAARRVRWDLVGHGAIVGIISAPSVLSHLWLVRTDPITAARASQNLLFTTDWWLVALSYGFLVPLALIGIVRVLRPACGTGSFGPMAIGPQDDQQTKRAHRLLVTWLVVTVVLMYSPLTWQRRLVEGLHVVLVIIAMVGLFPFLAWLRAHAPMWIHRYAWGVTTATIVAIPLLGVSTIVNLVRDVALYTIRFPQSIPRHSFYYPTDALDAMRWIRGHASLGEATFAVGIDGHFLPMFAARQTVLGHGVETAHFVEKYETSYALTGGELALAEVRAFLERERVRFILVTDASRGLWVIDPATNTNRGRLIANWL
ncbi:glycosyltransferase family 2 protein, partial [Candidatus Uhrbacteria bacterium]|nr:glycosyltransferase family 2 protein [Candidatus Uhrbacteria bacterium]